MRSFGSLPRDLSKKRFRRRIVTTSLEASAAVPVPLRLMRKRRSMRLSS